MRPKKSLLSWTTIRIFYVCIVFSQFAFAQTADFSIQHIQDDIGRNGGTNTSFTAVSSLDKAFVLANNNRKVHGGRVDAASNLEGDDMAGARQLTAVNTLTYYREANSRNNDMRFNSSIWEYVGPDEGNNEFIVRGRYVINLNGTTNSVTQTLSNITDADRCIPFITGITNNSTNNDADSTTAIAYLEDDTTLRVQKGSNNHNVAVYVTVVEFTGCNWTVLHGDSGDVSADTGSMTLFDGSDATGNATDVSDWSEAMIFGHFRADNNANGQNQAIADLWPLLSPGSNDQTVDWTFKNNHDSNGTNRHFVHVLANEGINITRYQDTQNGAGENTIDITSAGITATTEALVIGSSISTGNGTAYARGWRNYYFNSTNEVAHWSHRSGNNMDHEIQIVDLSGLNSLQPQISVPELPSTYASCGDTSLDVNANVTDIPYTNNTYQWSYTVESGTSTAPVTFTPGNTASTTIYFPENTGDVVFKITLTFSSAADCGKPVVETYESLVTVNETTTANAGTDQIISNMYCGTNQVALSASNTVGYVGTWSVVTGAGGSFTDVNDENTIFTGNAGATYTLRWSIQCSEDDVTITLPDNCDNIGFDGTNNYINLGDTYDATASFTHEIWINPTSLTGTHIIYSKRSTDDLTNGYDLRLTNSTLSFNWNSGNSISSPYALSINKWYQAVVSFDGTNYRLYIDGIEVSTTTGSAPIANAHDYILGAINQSSNPIQDPPVDHFDGLLDELRIWNTALTASQIREMMNQEIQANTSAVQGSVIAQDVTGIDWNTNLLGYYQMNQDSDVSGGYLRDQSSNTNDGKLRNSSGAPQVESCPLPYTSKANGAWNDNTASTPWTYGDSVWNLPNSIGIDGSTVVEWNIVQTDHNITIDTFSGLGRARVVLGLIVNSNELQVNGDSGLGTGNALHIDRYLKINGKLDLEGESQLIQPENSVLDASSAGTLERDQQGTADLYTYNYWSTPVGATNATTNNNSYTLPDVINDGTNPATPATIIWISNDADGDTGPPISLSTYWIYKYSNLPSDDYSAWQYVGNTGTINPGEGYTMKGTANTGGVITTEQNYVFEGKPYNGDITLTLSSGNDYLVGNPYASAIDADEFILDNTSSNGGRAATDIINGTLYFWDHFANASHYPSDYEGGYATYTRMGATVAISNDERINNSGAIGTKLPQRYIPVGQGFFVTADDGGVITFKNSQRTFKTEVSDPSLFIRSSGDKNVSKVETLRSADTREKIRLLFTSPKGYQRQLLVGVDPVATTGHDVGFDALLIEDNTEDMYWYFNEDKYVIQATDHFNADKILPLGVKIEEIGIITISINELLNIDSSKDIYLHDKELEVYHNLRLSDYNATIGTGEFNNRFEIVFTGNMSLSTQEEVNMEVGLYFSNASESIVIYNPKHKFLENIEMFNLLGQVVYTSKLKSTNNETSIKIGNLTTGTYILKLTSEGSTITKKVIVD